MQMTRMAALSNIGEDNKEFSIDLYENGQYEFGLYDMDEPYGPDSCYSDFISKDDLIRLRDVINGVLDSAEEDEDEEDE